MRFPQTRRCLSVLAALALTVAAPAAWATDYTENEPNNNFPPTFLPGNPVFVSGDRLTGSIATGTDFDDHYITFGGPAAPGLYRYTFDLATGGGDSFLDIYEAGTNGFSVGQSDDFPGLGVASRVIFDQFQSNLANTIFGVSVSGFGGIFNYQMTVTRTSTPVNTIGALATGMTSRTNGTPAGAGTWYSFTLGSAGVLTADTLGSLNDDTEIALFDAAGNTLIADDDSGAGLLSAFTIALGAGDYYVAVGPFNSLYNWNLTTGTTGGWDRNGFSGGGDGFSSGNNLLAHNLNLTFNAAAVPEPSTFALLGLGLLGIGGVAVRRRSAAA